MKEIAVVALAIAAVACIAAEVMPPKKPVMPTVKNAETMSNYIAAARAYYTYTASTNRENVIRRTATNGMVRVLVKNNGGAK